MQTSSANAFDAVNADAIADEIDAQPIVDGSPIVDGAPILDGTRQLDWAPHPSLDAETVASVRAAVNSFPAAHLLPPKSGEEFDSIDAGVQRLQNHAFANGFCLVKTSSIAGPEGFVRIACVHHGTETRNHRGLTEADRHRKQNEFGEGSIGRPNQHFNQRGCLYSARIANRRVPRSGGRRSNVLKMGPDRHNHEPLPNPFSYHSHRRINTGSLRQKYTDETPTRPVSGVTRQQPINDPRLLCNVDPSRVQSRWLQTPTIEVGNSLVGIDNHIFRILKSYTSMAVNGSSTPPFIHTTQLENTDSCKPLHSCLRIVRVCDNRLPGSHTLAEGLFENAMSTLVVEQPSYKGFTLLAAFQAFLLYTMTAFFQFEPSDTQKLREYMEDLLQLARAVCTQGTVTAAELLHIRPERDAWTLVEASRRTLYTMYLFDNLLCVTDTKPSSMANVPRILLAPAGRSLWQAVTDSGWQSAYNLHLSRWQNSSLTLDELWSSPDTSQDIRQTRSNRVDTWIEGLDEFGTTLYIAFSLMQGSEIMS